MKRLGLVVAFVLLCAASAAGAMTREQAKKVIAEYGLPETADGMLAVLNSSMPPLVVEAYLTLGTRADREITYEADGQQTLTRYPLTYLLMFWCAGDTTAAKAKLLVDAGADPNTTDPENDWAALSQAHACPDVIRVLLDAPKKPDVNRVDRNGNTAMHLVVSIGGDRQVESIRMLLDAGFDIDRWRDELLRDARNNAPVVAALGGKPATPAPATPPASQPPPAGRIDWKALPPYPERTPADAKKMLERPGAVTTLDEHMWTGITHREPLRLALALKGGADVRPTREVTGFTPLVLLAERCDLEDAEIQTANAELLTGAGADLAGVDSNGANALVLAAGSCPAGVVRALLAAGVSPHVRTKKGSTALRNAIEEERVDVVEMLLEAGVDPRKEPYNVRALASGNSEIEAVLRKKRLKR